MFSGPFDFSIVKRAKEAGKVEINIVNIRDYGIGKHKVVDDTPYGGGIGMVMRADVLREAITRIKNPTLAEATAGKQKSKMNKEKVILLSASGKTFNQSVAKSFSKLDHLIVICGHYEGIDARIMKYIDEEISIGDFVVTGGEIPAMMITDSVTRLIPGVLKEGVTDAESFSLTNEDSALLEYPQYTKPPVFDGQKVPEVLTSGNHRKIHEWRMGEALNKTQLKRPDLIKKI